MNNHAGFITLDFIFALTLSFGFTFVFLGLTVALSYFEVTQYIAFATARVYAGAHESENEQRELAQQKFAEILSQPVFKKLYSNGWFNIDRNIVLKDFADEYPEGEVPDRTTATGVEIKTDASILRFNVPLWGPTFKNDNVGKANVRAFVLREVTTNECQENFNKKRYENILQLGGGSGGSYANTPNSSAFLITDNGC